MCIVKALVVCFQNCFYGSAFSMSTLAKSLKNRIVPKPQAAIDSSHLPN